MRRFTQLTNALSATILTVFHGAPSSRTPAWVRPGIAVPVEALLFYVALVVSLGGALLVYRRLWTWSK
jgi:hypothetical protein